MKNVIKEFVMKNKYVIIAIFLLVSILIGGTYAWLRIEILGTKTNRIDIGSLSLELDESTCDGISVVNGVPVTDEEGMKGVACTFSVTNNGDVNTRYSVMIDDKELSSGEVRMDDSHVKFGYIKNSDAPVIGVLDTIGINPNRKMNTEVINVGDTDTYELRFWIDKNADASVMGKVFSSSIRIVAEMDKNYHLESFYVYEDFLFVDGGGNVPIDGYNVLLTEEFRYSLENNLIFEDSNGVIWNPRDSLPNPGNTYKGESVSHYYETFLGLSIKGEFGDLDLSLWDTSNIVNMKGMFYICDATMIDLSSFDTSNVTDMSWMFSGSTATSLDLSGFDTSYVTDMSWIFSDSAVTSLDLSGFDTSNVTDMSWMFYSTAANPIYVKDQAMIDRFVNEGDAIFDRLIIK